MRDARIRGCTKQQQLTVSCSVPAHAAHAATPSCRFLRRSRTQRGRMCHQGEPLSQVAMPPLRHSLGVATPACIAQSTAVKPLLESAGAARLLPQTHSTPTHRWEASTAGKTPWQERHTAVLAHARVCGAPSDKTHGSVTLYANDDDNICALTDLTLVNHT